MVFRKPCGEGECFPWSILGPWLLACAFFGGSGRGRSLPPGERLLGASVAVLSVCYLRVNVMPKHSNRCRGFLPLLASRIGVILNRGAVLENVSLSGEPLLIPYYPPPPDDHQYRALAARRRRHGDAAFSVRAGGRKTSNPVPPATQKTPSGRQKKETDNRRWLMMAQGGIQDLC